MTALLIAAGFFAALLSVVTVTLLAAIIINLATRVPYAATPHQQVDRILDVAQLRPGQRVYDLGCGDGRVVFAAARRGAVATGFELQPLTFARAKLLQRLRYPTAAIRYGSFRRADLFDADMIFCFLVDRVMGSTAAFLAGKLAPGCIVISYGFPLPGWQPYETLEPLAGQRSAVYFYRIS